MSVEVIAIIVVLALFALLAAGFPVAFSLLCVGAVGYIVFIGPKVLYNMVPIFFDTLTKDIYIAIPMFVFMASLLQTSGVGEALYDTMYKWLAGLRGGLAMATVGFCTIVAATTGLSATGTITMGMIAYPEMRKRHYDIKLAVGCIPAGGALGPLIPPSITAIIVASLTTLSVGKLFMAGVFPGLICSFLFILYIGFRCSLRPSLGPSIPVAERPGWKDKFASLVGLILPLSLIILVLGAIYTGAATPSEVGGVGAVGAFICMLVNRKFSWKNLSATVITAFRVNCMVMFLVLGGGVFASLMFMTGISGYLSNFLLSLTLDTMGILIVMLIIILVMGMFIDTVAIVMIALPIMFPVAIGLGIDLLWFGFLFTFALIVGMITPPFGYNLFYFKGLGHKDVSMADIYMGVIPYVFLMLIAFALCIAFPQIALWIPGMMK